jgi:hypothetical protein
MEKFKACEKEMKTKAFSKEGLIQAAKLDPKEQEKEESKAWLQSQVEELQMQIEQTEAEIESLQGTGKKRHKGGSAMSGRQEELEALNERRKWHSGRLELVLRLLDNGSLSTDQVNELKEDVEYFVQSNGVCPTCFSTDGSELNCVRRRKTLLKMKGYTKTLILTRRKRSLVWVVKMRSQTNRTVRARVCSAIPFRNLLFIPFSQSMTYRHQDPPRNMTKRACQVVKGTQAVLY